MEWLLTPLGFLGAVISGGVGGAALWDRWTRYRNQITGEIEIDVLPGTIELPGENPWDPPVVEDGISDGIIVRATIHNNTSGPIVVEEWLVEGPAMEHGPLARHETIEAGKTGTAITEFVPDWRRWDHALEAGLTERSEPLVRVSLRALSRASSRRLTLRSARYNVTDEIVKNNVDRANKAAAIM
jgi:hypothetical protein